MGKHLTPQNPRRKPINQIRTPLKKERPGHLLTGPLD